MQKISILEQRIDDLKEQLRKKMGDKFDSDFVNDLFLIDPTNDTINKYAFWLQKQYSLGNITEDNYTNVKMWLDTYHNLSERKLLPPEYKDITPLSVNDLVNIHNTMRNKLETTRKETQKTDEISRLKSIFKNQIETNNWYIIDVKTREDQIEQGRHTKWCIQGTNTQGKTLRDIYYQEFQDIWKDERLSEIMDYIMRSMGVQPTNDEDKFEQFYEMQKHQIPRMERQYLSQHDINNLDEVSKQYKLLFTQYMEFEKRDGDGHIWQQIYKPNPFYKFQFIFGIGEFRDQENNMLNLATLSNFVLSTKNENGSTQVQYKIPKDHVKELIQVFSKYPKQKTVIQKQINGEYIPDYIDYIKEHMM